MSLTVHCSLFNTVFLLKREDDAIFFLHFYVFSRAGTFFNNFSASNKILTFLKIQFWGAFPKIFCSNRNSFCCFGFLEDKGKYNNSVPENNLHMIMTANIIKNAF